MRDLISSYGGMLALLVASLGFFLNVYQSRRSNRQSRANFVAESFRFFLSDDAMQSAFYRIEYDNFVYGPEFHESSVERDTDRLLRLFSNIARLVELRLVALHDLSPFAYYFLRIYDNIEVQRYFAFLLGLCQDEKLGPHPFESFIRVAYQLDVRQRSNMPWRIRRGPPSAGEIVRRQTNSLPERSEDE